MHHSILNSTSACFGSSLFSSDQAPVMGVAKEVTELLFAHARLPHRVPSGEIVFHALDMSRGADASLGIKA
jgi:hypothetical protein